MTDTVETLRADLDALRAEFEAFKLEAFPVIDSHKIMPEPPALRAVGAGPSLAEMFAERDRIVKNTPLR